MYKIILPMLMGCGAYNATNDNENIGFLEKNTNILLENDPNLVGLAQRFEESKKNFEIMVTNKKLHELIEEYKNALDHAAKDSDVKKCLNDYNKALSELLEAMDKDINSYFYFLNDTNIQFRIFISLLYNSNKNERTKFTNSTTALDKALREKFPNVIDLDNQLDQYYNQWSDENYSESEWIDIIPEPSRDPHKICNNLAQFTKFDHLKSYDFMINSKRELYQYLARLEAGSKEMRGAVADFRKTISGI